MVSVEIGVIGGDWVGLEMDGMVVVMMVDGGFWCAGVQGVGWHVE